MSASVLSSSLSRHRENGVIQNVHNGFFVVVPPQYALQGKLPVSYYISQLMSFLGRPYYISLLSAASPWGASHQAVMVTHVMTRLPYSSASRRKNDSLRWFYRKSIPSQHLLSKNGETAPIVYSNAELTAIDLVHWSARIGGISAVATALAELRESTNFAAAGVGVFRAADLSDIQRLGYIYDVVLGDREQADVIYDEMTKLSASIRNIRLVPEGRDSAICRNRRWHIDINETIEVDEL